MQRWFITIGILAILGILIAQPSTGWSIQRFLFEGVGAQVYSGDRNIQEAMLVKAEIARLEGLSSNSSHDLPGAQVAFVHSRYPFNFKNQIVVSLGSKQGVRVDNPVLLSIPQDGGKSNSLLLGKVIQVFPQSAVVQTVFDVGFQTPVRIGEKAVDALFTGGPEPKLTLIPKTAALNRGDVVLSAAPHMPYGLPVALIEEVKMSQNRVFEEATLAFGYDLNDVKTVTILTSTDE